MGEVIQRTRGRGEMEDEGEKTVMKWRATSGRPSRDGELHAKELTNEGQRGAFVVLTVPEVPARKSGRAGRQGNFLSCTGNMTFPVSIFDIMGWLGPRRVRVPRHHEDANKTSPMERRCRALPWQRQTSSVL
ncbi:hypothetical protein D4764_03G0005950 [Takifugu flavidus]|uniref:Uncharacterized protein n=1 Tax=Takifugu flavidus TaxID=433684 RepID=A0A5C6NDJ7_9TELE|nr:hypothetical protein D4764_03G0005950 [Takifugu flavidus]